MAKPRIKHAREKDDNYPTPERLADAITQRLLNMYGDVSRTHILLEPSAGSGMFVRAMRKYWPNGTIWANELRHQEEENLRRSGANYVLIHDWSHWTAQYASSMQAPGFVIGNPPFTLAQKHLEDIFNHLPDGTEVAFLLRLSFFGGNVRNQTFWNGRGKRFLKYLIPIAPRPQFVRGTSDNSEYGVFIWQKGYQGDSEILPAIIWEKKAPRQESRNVQEG